MRVEPHADLVHEFAQPIGEPIEVGPVGRSGVDQARAREVEALPPESPVIGPPEGGVDSDPHDFGAGDGWVPL